MLVTLGKPLHVYSGLLGDTVLSEYDSFSGKMVWNRIFLHVNCSVPPGYRALSQYNSFSGKTS